MCDTFVALSDATADGSVILGKNSDREPNEAHEVIVVPAAVHPTGSTVRCTYVQIEQAPRTNRVLLAKPYWIWGAEMGVNEHGVVIGNEAVFTGVEQESEPGLLGMDLLRLALERAGDRVAAVAVITDLLGRHGQGGQAGHTHNLRYDNSYVVADPTGAVIVETMGRDWVTREVSGSDSISNAVTTTTEWDQASTGVLAAVGDGSVAARYSDFLFTTFSAARARQCRTSDALLDRRGSITVGDAMTLLRDHGPHGSDPRWSPAGALTGQTVCAHAGFGPIRVAQTTGSLVAHIRPEGTTVFVTATSAPCTGTFKPVWVDTGVPPSGSAPGRYWDSDSLWWRHERLHREILHDFPTRLAVRRRQRDEMERDLIASADATAGVEDRRRATDSAFRRVAAFESEWLDTVLDLPLTSTKPTRAITTPFRSAWAGFDRAAKRYERRSFANG